MTRLVIVCSMIALAGALQAPPDDLVLKGYIVAPDASRSIAILAADGRTVVVAVGERAFGGRLIAVSADGATLDFNGSQILVRLGGLAPSAPAPVISDRGVSSQRSPAVAPATSAPPIVAEPETISRVMSRAEVERRLGSEMNRIMTEASLRQVEDGGVKGIEMATVPDGTLLADVGLRNGDVLTDINGTKIDSLATMAALYMKLQTESQLRAVVLRGGRTVILKLSLQ